MKMASPLGWATVLSYGWAATTAPPRARTCASTVRTGQGRAAPKSASSGGTAAGSGKKQR